MENILYSEIEQPPGRHRRNIDNCVVLPSAVRPDHGLEAVPAPPPSPPPPLPFFLPIAPKDSPTTPSRALSILAS